MQRPFQHSTRLIVIQNGREGAAMSVKKVLVVFLVEVFLALFRISQQRIGKLVQRALVCLVFFSANVDYNWFSQ